MEFEMKQKWNPKVGTAWMGNPERSTEYQQTRPDIQMNERRYRLRVHPKSEETQEDFLKRKSKHDAKLTELIGDTESEADDNFSMGYTTDTDSSIEEISQGLKSAFAEQP